jgi:hypothetical protein
MVVTQQTENEQLRAQWQEANALVEHLRRQLADVTAQRDLLIAMCPAEKENAQLRAQLAQLRALPECWRQNARALPTKLSPGLEACAKELERALAKEKPCA